MQKIFFHCDDYGISPSVNRQIIKYIKQDKIDSLSVICNSYYYKNNIIKLKKLIKKKNIDIYCHINLTDFKALKLNLNFFKIFLLNFFSIFFNKNFVNKIKNNICNQIDIFIKNFHTKNKTLYIDGHQHIHMNTFIFNLIKDYLIKKKMKFKFRNSNEVFFFYLTSKSIINYLKLFIIKFLKLTLGKKNDKYFDNKMFFGLIGSGIQNEFLLKKIIKLIKKKKN